MTENATQQAGIAPATVYQVAALAAPQEGSIVSRTLVNAPTGSLTLFAFAEGQRLSEHTAPFDAFAHVLEGSAAITIDGVTHEVDRGHAVLMPANVPHAVHAKQPFTMALTMFKSERR